MNIRVLLVDDEKDFIDLLAERLGVRGLQVVTAPDAEQALMQLREREADVVVLDIEMPGKDGISALHEMKRMRPFIQVIMLTGHATAESANECFEQGAYDFITKPPEISDLVEKITCAWKLKIKRQERTGETGALPMKLSQE